jgi:dihydrofolate reductase
MRKIILWMSMSLDGFFESLDYDISWHQVDDELLRHMNHELGQMGAFMHGRKTYELMAGVWTAAGNDPDLPPLMAEFAGIWCTIPKFVFSRSLTQAGWGTTVLPGVVPQHIAELKAQPGGDIALSGANLAAALMRHGLVDEFRIYVHPIVLGRGRPLFEDPGIRLSLRLRQTRRFGNGVVLLHYANDAGPTPT